MAWAGSQITRADAVVFNPEQKLHTPDSVSPELEEQGRVGLDLLQRVEPDLALSPEGIGRRQPRVYPRDTVGMGTRPSSWVLLRYPTRVSKPGSGWSPGKGAKRNKRHRCGPYKGSVNPGAPGS